MNVAENARGNLFKRDFSGLKCLNPPYKEQKEITDYLDAPINKMDSLIENIQTSIKILNEFRESLISELVTGKNRIKKNNGSAHYHGGRREHHGSEADGPGVYDSLVQRHALFDAKLDKIHQNDGISYHNAGSGDKTDH